MRRYFIAILSAFALLAVPATASAAPTPGLGSSGSLGSSLLDSGSLDSASGSLDWGSLAPDDEQTYEELDPTSGTLISTSGFQVDRDGFKYENWSTPTAEHPRSLTPQLMQTLYGDKICARIDNGECALTATGQALQADLNDFLDGGHCYGFAAASGQFTTGVIAKSDYLRPDTTVFENDPTDKLDGLISRYAAAQFSSPTEDGTARHSVSETLDMIEAAWEQDSNYVLSVYGDVGGHAVTPIALRDLGNGKTGIVVYDNNFPGVEKMVVADRAANTWYYIALLNPTTPAYLFVGSPANLLELSELEPSSQLQECPTCIDGDESVLVLVRDNAENPDGSMIATDVNLQLPGGGEVPGMTQRKLVNTQKAALYSVPAGTAFEIKLDGAPSGLTADIDISLYGDGWVNELDNIALAPGAAATVGVDAAQRKLSLSGTTTFEPHLMLATEQANWSVSSRGTGLRLQPGSVLTVERDANGDVVYGLSGAGDPASMRISVKRLDASGDKNVSTAGPVIIPVNSEASLAANVWDGISPLSVRVVGVDVDESYPMS